MSAAHWLVLAISALPTLAGSFIAFAIRGERRQSRRERGW